MMSLTKTAKSGTVSLQSTALDKFLGKELAAAEGISLSIQQRNAIINENLKRSDSKYLTA